MASSGGGWGTVFKQELGKGGYNFYLKIFRGGSVLKHYTFLKTTAPPVGRNKRSVPYFAFRYGEKSSLDRPSFTSIQVFHFKICVKKKGKKEIRFD